LTGLDTVFEELGQRLGLREVRFGKDEPFTLIIDGAGTVTFEMSGDLGDLLISLAWPLPAYDKETLPRALAACSLENSLDFPLQAGLFNDELLLMVRRNPAQLSAPDLEALVLKLVKIRDQLSRT
jgi:type III secretion system chaperone SycN